MCPLVTAPAQVVLATPTSANIDGNLVPVRTITEFKQAPCVGSACALWSPESGRVLPMSKRGRCGLAPSAPVFNDPQKGPPS